MEYVSLTIEWVDMLFQVTHVGRDELPGDHVYVRPGGFPHWLVGYLIQGHSRMTANGITEVYPPGWFAVLPPNTGFRVEFGGGDLPWIDYWMFFTPSEIDTDLLALPQLPTGHRGFILRGGSSEMTIRETFREAHRWRVEARPDAFRFAGNALERILLLAKDAVREISIGCHDDRILEIREYLMKNLNIRHTVASLATRVHLSPPRFAALFRREAGDSPMRYLESLRMGQACELLLRTSRSIADIAEEVGYANQHHFSARFHSHSGQSPRQYRLFPRPSKP